MPFDKIKYNYSKTFGLFLSFIGFLVVGLSIINNYMTLGFFSFVNPLNIITLLLSIIVFISSFFRFSYLFQIICLALTSLITLFDNPEQSFAVLQIILVLIISYKNGLLFENLIKKIIISIFLFCMTIILSVIINNISIIRIIPTLLFFTIFLTSLFILLKDELNKYLAEIRTHKKNIASLKQTLIKTLEEVERNNSKHLDPNDYDLTPTEYQILESICLYRETNKELAYRHNKSPNTIKVQITQILIKTKLRDRYELIEFFSNYFESSRTEK